MAGYNEDTVYTYPVTPDVVVWAPGASYAVAAPPGESGETDTAVTTAAYDMGYFTDAGMLQGMDHSEYGHHYPMTTAPYPARLAEGGRSDLNDDICHSQDGESDHSRTSFLDALSSDEDGGSELSRGFRDPEGNLVLLERALTMDEDSMLEAGETADTNASKADARSTSPASAEPQSSNKRTNRSQKQTNPRNRRPSTKKEKRPSGASILGVNKATKPKRSTPGGRTLKSASETSSGSFNAASTVAIQDTQRKGKQKRSGASKVKCETIDPTPKDWRSWYPNSLPDRIRLLADDLEMTVIGHKETPAIRNRRTGISVTVSGITLKKWKDNVTYEVGTYPEAYLRGCEIHLHEKAFITSISTNKSHGVQRFRHVVTAMLESCEYTEWNLELNLSVDELAILSEEFIRRNIEPDTRESTALGLKVKKHTHVPAPQHNASTSLGIDTIPSSLHTGL